MEQMPLKVLEILILILSEQPAMVVISVVKFANRSMQ